MNGRIHKCEGKAEVSLPQPLRACLQTFGRMPLPSQGRKIRDQKFCYHRHCLEGGGGAVALSNALKKPPQSSFSKREDFSNPRSPMTAAPPPLVPAKHNRLNVAPKPLPLPVCLPASPPPPSPSLSSNAGLLFSPMFTHAHPTAYTVDYAWAHYMEKQIEQWLVDVNREDGDIMYIYVHKISLLVLAYVQPSSM